MDSGLAVSRRSGMTLTPILGSGGASTSYFLQRVYFLFPKLPRGRRSGEAFLYSRKPNVIFPCRAIYFSFARRAFI
jgi:hypothetical protein